MVVVDVAVSEAVHLRFPPSEPNMLARSRHITPTYWYGFLYFPLPAEIPIPKYGLFQKKYLSLS